MTTIETTEKITASTIPAYEALSPGHRACQGCGEVLAMRIAMKALGKNTVVVSATGCMEVITSPYPQTAWEVPWMHVAFENASAVGSGVAAARKVLLRNGRISDKDTKLVIIGGDGATSDIGFQSLSGALERGHDFVYLCLDNEAYMNTGIQRSSATPAGAWTTTCPTGSHCDGKSTAKKDLSAIVAAHGVPYVATATPAHHLDLMNKVRRAANMSGPAFIHIFSPCPTGWRMLPNKVLDVCKLAVRTKVYPLYEVINGKCVIERKITKALPVSEYLKIQGRFRHLSEEQITKIQSDVDRKYDELVRLSEM
jgi:pyruvate ferredoxin oxidoreductase beta subunit